MFSLTVCDHIMVAHSFRGAEFGPAQRLHGATFAVEAEFRAPKLDHLHLLVDIGLAKQELRRALDTLDYRNLDAEPQFAGRNTTTEYLALHIHGLLADPVFDVLLTGESGFEDLPAVLSDLAGDALPALCHLVRYDPGV